MHSSSGVFKGRQHRMGFLQLRLWGAIAATAIVIALNTALARL